MRLSKIKLAGFKSFVDPTTVPLPGDIVAVVGPNGCGKSNVIDAVRWVMGESSAKHLRGESMADVIFNGSNSRKPVGTASIELLFDNSDGSLGGKYASYGEISVKRQVNREGQSAYYLNATRCRKRDITDVFLGTGLGPRSYSIIEQDMISRVIEARPEDLRSYLEEAAGISLYKERRRETERRIRDTLENLERLDDVRDEIGRQLDRLQRQAEAAERYKALKAEERERRGELYVLKLRALDAEREALRVELGERANALEAEVAQQRSLQREAESVRARHGEDSDRLNEIQGRYYALGSDIARIEQRISHQRELRDNATRELESNRDAIAELDRSLETDRGELAVLRARLDELAPEVEAAAEQEALAREQMSAVQTQLEQWRERWERFNADAAEPVREAQIERARIEQLERRTDELQRQRRKIAEELERLRLDDAATDLDDLRREEATATREADDGRERLDVLDRQLAEQRTASDAADERIDALRGELHRDQARLVSLETLQQAALGDDEGVAAWLRERGLEAHRRLAQILTIEPGWELALETVLADRLQAVVVDRPHPQDCDAAALAQGVVTLYGPERNAAFEPQPSQRPRLIDYVNTPWPLDDLLGSVFAVDTLAEARSLVGRLDGHESVVTRDGVWLGRRWARIRAVDDGAEAGVLARERAMAELRASVTANEPRLESLVAERDSERAARREQGEQHDRLADDVAEWERRRASLQARIENRESRLAEARERLDNLETERHQLAEEGDRNDEDIAAARRRLEAALSRGESLDGQRERLAEDKRDIQHRLDAAEKRLRGQGAQREELALRRESAATAHQGLEQSLERMNSQRDRLATRHEELAANVDELGDPDGDLAEQRAQLLQRRAQVETELTQARARLGEADHRLRELETARAEVERKVADWRESLEAARFRDHELKIRAQTQSEQLAELGLQPETVAETLPEQADTDTWQTELERLEERVKRLGPINLAAIDEYRTLDERKGYLDDQHRDLSEALETLQSAIRRIDRDTRARFKETFEQVNAGMRRLFPKLFGGGQGYLELTGDDLLETGVAILAQPPGKKITNIHLLSGGEKALTAVALVFAIFELNPAPFCLLDEVDAPLDEANVERFCDLLRTMSQRVQFVVITHNKATMEAATHLTGVTMNEPGVSRLVTVDVDEAAELVAV